MNPCGRWKALAPASHARDISVNFWHTSSPHRHERPALPGFLSSLSSTRSGPAAQQGVQVSRLPGRHRHMHHDNNTPRPGPHALHTSCMNAAAEPSPLLQQDLHICRISSNCTARCHGVLILRCRPRLTATLQTNCRSSKSHNQHDGFPPTLCNTGTRLSVRQCVRRQARVQWAAAGD
jgi:hypothetical protein